MIADSPWPARLAAREKQTNNDLSTTGDSWFTTPVHSGSWHQGEHDSRILLPAKKELVMFCFRFSLFCLLYFVLRVGLVECVPTGTGKNHVSFYPHDHEYLVRVFDPRYSHPSRWTRTPAPMFRLALPTYKSATSRWTQTPAPVFCCGEFHGSHTSLFRSRPSRRTQAPLPSYLLCCVLDYLPPLFARWRRSLHPCPRKLPLSLCPFLFSLSTHLVSLCVSFPEESKL